MHEALATRERHRAVPAQGCMRSVPGLWGWDDTPGIVSVWAEASGRVTLWRRRPGQTEQLVCERATFRPWLLLASLTDLAHLGPRLLPCGAEQRADAVYHRELEGPGTLRYHVEASDGRLLARALSDGARQRLGRPLRSVRELGSAAVLALPPEEQYLLASGRNYFKGLTFDDLRRLTVDLETTGLDPEGDRIFLIALRTPSGDTEVLEARGPGSGGEAELLLEFAERVRALDPDVIENHHLHGFDLPFIARRSERLGVSLALGRAGPPGFGDRPAARGAALGGARPANGAARRRLTIVGRECIDTLDAVRRHDFSARDLPGHGLKAVARHFGLASAEREHVPGSRVYATYRTDPERVRRYAADDVSEASRLSRLLGGSAFALAQLVPRRYERLADAGPATGVLEPLLVRAYVRAGAALPVATEGDGTAHSGAALHLFASGVAERIVKADVASLYPSLMRQYRIGPSSDRLGALLAVIDRLVSDRLVAKQRARELPPGSSARHAEESLSAAMKLVVNSAYGYLGAVGLTRFADVHAANEVTRRGRELLHSICRELEARGVTLLEADTDGVYFSMRAGASEADERRLVSEVAALLPEHVHLEFDGRYAAMLSHEPKNYALLPYAGPLVVRGVAFRSSRYEAFGTEFARRAIEALLRFDVPAARRAYVETALALARRELPTRAVTTRVRLTKAPEEYLETRAARRELPYEALLAAGRSAWRAGATVRVYRAQGGRAALFEDGGDLELGEEGDTPLADARDYDVAYYTRLLRDTFAARLERALAREDFLELTADPGQPSLFDRGLADARPILTWHGWPEASG